MRTFKKLMAGAATAATVTAMVAAIPAMTGPALADPPAHTTVHNFDIVGVGSDTIQSVMDQLSLDFDAGQAAAHHSDSANTPRLYSWDALNPATGADENISFKSGCKAILRPNGSGAGIAALTTENAKDGGKVGTGNNNRQATCIDFARSSRDRAPTDPAFAKNGIAFTALGGDAVTYATQPGTLAPKTLTAKQLFAIYTCKDTLWTQVGGKKAPHGKSDAIKPFIPQAASGTRAFFLTAIGVVTPGGCVSDVGGRLEENEGVNIQLNQSKPNVIFPYSIGKYIAQAYHSAKCLKAFCKPETSGAHKGKVCLPGKGQDEFSCDMHGTMTLNKIGGSSPTVPFPLPKAGTCTSTAKCPVVNPKFAALFTRSLFVVVPFSTAKGNVNHIPPYLVPIFGPKGFACTSKTAKADLADYGFVVFGDGSTGGQSPTKCGDTH